ncbi:MAG: cob(I)yrinic acid a,c-diamide adenosyltransferase [Synergistaceae bacterium]|jgi:cob(I)alamin adenosyltransferase|nr:cob(I)yrinic acid a,c-diamide adenosyltransferase [Synergistaceae bacterium]
MKYDNERDVFTKGCVQVYTGNGKGKTTAAIGLAVRALGAGIEVFFAQFLKSGDYSEIQILRNLDNITCRQYGVGGFIARTPSSEDIASARRGVEDALRAMKGGDYGVVILDEANVAYSLGLISIEELMSLVRERPPAAELVLTGRGAPAELIAAADLVTEMREIKHYFNSGVKARKGIES